MLMVIKKRLRITPSIANKITNKTKNVYVYNLTQSRYLNHKKKSFRNKNNQ